MNTISIICYSLLVIQLIASVTTIVYARKYYRLCNLINKYNAERARRNAYGERYLIPPDYPDFTSNAEL